MHPLTIFPSLLTFGLIAPFLLRLAVGILRFFAGTERYKKEYKWVGVVTMISSIFLVLGLYTQIAVIVAIACIKFEYWIDKKAGKVSREKMALTILMTVILLSLLFTGPGFFGFDLPL